MQNPSIIQIAHRLYYNLRALNLKPKRWFLGTNTLYRLKAEYPIGAITVGPTHVADQLFGIPWEIDYENCDRLSLEPEYVGVEPLEAYPDADRLLRAALGEERE